MFSLRCNNINKFVPFNNFRHKKTFDEILPDAPADGVDLMKKLLHFNPDKRITADEALRHPFVHRLVSRGRMSLELDRELSNSAVYLSQHSF